MLIFVCFSSGLFIVFLLSSLHLGSFGAKGCGWEGYSLLIASNQSMDGNTWSGWIGVNGQIVNRWMGTSSIATSGGFVMCVFCF